MENRACAGVGKGIVIAVAAVASAALLAGAIRDVRSGEKTFSVTGSATRTVRSDYAVWNPYVRVRDKDLVSAHTSITDAAEKVREFFRDAGFGDTEVRQLPIRIETLKAPNPAGYGTTEDIVGYEVTQEFEVSSRDLARILSATRDSAKLLRAGLYFEPGNPSFFYTELETLKVGLIGEAAADALKRAEAIANATGSTLGPARSGRVGVFQLRPAHSTEVSDAGMLDVSSEEKEAMAVVTIGFEVE